MKRFSSMLAATALASFGLICVGCDHGMTPGPGPEEGTHGGAVDQRTRDEQTEVNMGARPGELGNPNIANPNNGGMGNDLNHTVTPPNGAVGGNAAAPSQAGGTDSNHTGNGSTTDMGTATPTESNTQNNANK